MAAKAYLSLITLLWLVPGTALAQASEEAPNAVSQVANLIRWGGVFTSTFVVLGAWFAVRMVHGVVEQLGRQFTDRRLTFQKLETILQFFIYVGTFVTICLLSLRIDEKVLALIGGTLAVSVGFAIKDLVASFIAGIMIMVDRPFQVGDRVSFGGHYGDITGIGLRTVRMQTLNDDTVTIPNNKFINDITASSNYGALDMQVTMPFYIGVDQDVDLARDLLHDAAISSRYVYLPKPITVRVKQLIKDSHVAVELLVKAYVLDTRFEKDFESDVHLRSMRAFRQHGILPPAILHRDSSDTSAHKPATVRPRAQA